MLLLDTNAFLQSMADSPLVPEILAIAFAVAAAYSVRWRIRTGRGIATAVAVVSALLCLLALLSWAGYYE